MTPNILTPSALPQDWLSPEELRALTPEKLASRVAELKPLIASHAREVERHRKPSDEVWNALRKTGFFYHFVPKPHGLEFGPEDFIDTVLPIAEACPSTAWAASFVAVHAIVFAGFNKQAQDEMFGKTPYVSAPAVQTPPGKLTKVDGGYRLSAHYKWGTGVMHSDWVLAIAVIQGTKPAALRYAVLPIDQVKILDTWNSDGMIGTGSHDVLIEDVFIPEHMTLDVALMRSGGASPGAELHKHNPLYSAPSLPLMVMAAAISATGAAKGAVQFYKVHMQKRVQFASTTSTSERASTQMRLGHADLLARESEILLRDMARKYEARMYQPEPFHVSERLALRAQAAYAVSVAKRCIDVLCEAAGAGAHALDNPLQRYLRDVSVLSSHVAFDLDLAMEQHGRTMLGLEPTSAYA